MNRIPFAASVMTRQIRGAGGLGGYFETDDSGVTYFVGDDGDAAPIADQGGSMLSDLTKVIPAVLQYDMQRQLMLVNVDRAKKGLPPINTAQYAPGVNVGVTDNTQKLILTGLGIFAGAWVLSSLIGRR